jgi:hypothetical protein
MSGFDLPNNYLNNLEALLRKNRSRASSSSATPWQSNHSPPYDPLLSPWPSHSATTPPLLLPMCPLGPLSTLGPKTLSCALP